MYCTVARNHSLSDLLLPSSRRTHVSFLLQNLLPNLHSPKPSLKKRLPQLQKTSQNYGKLFQVYWPNLTNSLEIRKLTKLLTLSWPCTLSRLFLLKLLKSSLLRMRNVWNTSRSSTTANQSSLWRKDKTSQKIN